MSILDFKESYGVVMWGKVHYGNCLNACDTPAFVSLGFYPAGTIQCFVLSSACLGLPAGAKIMLIE